MNRTLLKEYTKELLEENPNLTLSRATQSKGMVAREHKKYTEAPFEVKEVVSEKNKAYKMLSDRFAALKQAAFSQLKLKLTKKVAFRDCLKIMDSRDAAGNANIFGITYVDNNGEIHVYKAICLTKLLNKTIKKPYRQIKLTEEYRYKNEVLGADDQTSN